MNHLPTATQNQLFEALLNTTDVASVVTDPQQTDNPIIYTNQEFLDMTGYVKDEVLGRNCRFLQGPETDPQTVSELRNSIRNEQEVSVTIQNHRKDGSPFWNRLHIQPVHVEDTLYFISSQTDITNEVEQLLLLSEKEQEITNQLLPILPIEINIGAVALVGKMNKERVNVLTTKISTYVQSTSTKHIIFDITGTIWEEEFFHNDLLMVQDVLRLMGSQLYITGITPTAAMQIVAGKDDRELFQTFASVEQALAYIRHIQ